MARGIPARQEGVVLLPTAPLAFPPGAGGGRTGSVISPALFNHFVSGCPIPDTDMTSYADDFTLQASAPSIAKVETRANRLCSLLVRGADCKQLAIAPQKSIVTLFTSDTHQSRLHTQVRIGDAVAPLNRTPKILDVTLDTHFTFSPHTRDCVERASRAPYVMEALPGSSWGFSTETLVAKYKAIVSLMVNYAAPIWFTQGSWTHLDKLGVIQNQVLRVATGCHLKTAASHLTAETGVLPLRAHLEMCCQQFYASALQPLLPSHLIVTSPPTPAPTPRATLQASYHRSLRGLRVRGDDPNSHLRGACWKRAPSPWPDASSEARWSRRPSDRRHPTRLSWPPLLQLSLPINCYRDHTGAPSIQLRSGHSSQHMSYRHSVSWADNPTCPDCRSTDHTVSHLLSCLTHPTDLATGDLWTAPLQVAQFLAGLPQFSDLPPLQIDFNSFSS